MTFQAGSSFVVDPGDPVNTAFLTDLFVTPDGGFQVVWQTLASVDGVQTVTEHYRLYDAAGAPITDVIDAGSWQGGMAPTHLQPTLTLADGSSLKQVLSNPTNPSFPPTQSQLQQFDPDGVPLGDPILTIGLNQDAMLQLPNGDVVFLDQPVSKTSIGGISGWVLHNTAPVPTTDTTAPSAVDLFPAAGSKQLPPDWSLAITFSEAVMAGAGSITLQTAAGQVVQTFDAAADPGIHFEGAMLFINPANDLLPGTAYQLVVDATAVQDLAGNVYGGLNGYGFATAGSAPSTGDTTAPAAIDFFPATGSNTLPPDWSLAITFDEAVKAGWGSITLETAAGQVVQSFATASDPGIHFDGATVIIDPAADLQPGGTYKLVVAPVAVQDLAGNAYAGESDVVFTTATLVGVAAG